MLYSTGDCAEYPYNILITGVSIDDRLKNLEAVLMKLKDAGLRLNRSKCFVCHSRISGPHYFKNTWATLFLNTASSQHPRRFVQSKKHLLLRTSPNCVHSSDLLTTMRNSFRISYHNLFHSTLPCTRITWGQKQSQALQATQNALQADSLLVHYDPSKPIVLSCDASPYGIGETTNRIDQ